MARFTKSANKFAAKERRQPAPTQQSLKLCQRRLTLLSGGEFIRWPLALLLSLMLWAPTQLGAQNLDHLLAPTTPYQWFASTDTKHQNHDYLELKPNETRRIPLTGGQLLRLWFTSSNPDKCDVSLQNGPQNVDLLRDGKANFGELWNKAWLLYPSQNADSSTRLGKLSANAALIVTNHDNDTLKFFYQAAIASATPKTIPLPSGKTSQIVSDWGTAPGKSHDFLANAPVGVLESIDLIVGYSDARGDNKRPLAQVLNDLHLRAYWDGERNAAIDVPLSLLAAGNAENVPDSAVGALQKDHFALKWPITLPKNRKLELFNAGHDSVGVLITSTIRALPEARLPLWRFHARVGSSRTEMDKPVSMLKAEGEGAFVGLNLDIRPVAGANRRTFAFLEGNETITADGTSHEGTGTEDFFNSAWYFPDTPFARPFGGLTRKTLAPPGVSAYRLMILDAVPFKKSFSFDFGHNGRNHDDDMEYRWVAFWYQKAGGAFQIEDKLAQSGVKAADSRNPTETASSNKSFFYLAAALLFGGALAARQLSRRKNHSQRK